MGRRTARIRGTIIGSAIAGRRLVSPAIASIVVGSVNRLRRGVRGRIERHGFLSLVINVHRRVPWWLRASNYLIALRVIACARDSCRYAAISVIIRRRSPR
jgi:hypothetical protein